MFCFCNAFVWIPPHSQWFCMRRVESIHHSLPLPPVSFAVKSGSIVFTSAGATHSELSAAMTKCNPPRRGIKHVCFVSSSDLETIPPPSPPLIARVNITDFYFPLFTFYYRVVYIFSPPPSSCRWSSLSLCIFVNNLFFFHNWKCKYSKEEKLSLLLMFVDALSLSFLVEIVT